MAFTVLTDSDGNEHYVNTDLIARYAMLNAGIGKGAIRVMVSGAGFITLDPSVGLDDLANLITPGTTAASIPKLPGTVRSAQAQQTQVGA